MRTARVSRAETYIIWKDVVTLVRVYIRVRVSSGTIVADAEARAVQATGSIPPVYREGGTKRKIDRQREEREREREIYARVALNSADCRCWFMRAE